MYVQIANYEGLQMPLCQELLFTQMDFRMRLSLFIIYIYLVETADQELTQM